MRMWLIPPHLLCKNHLLGEHKELHMLLGCLNKNKNITGFITKKFVDTSKMVSRHIELVNEMKRRGWNHNSPLDYFGDRFVGSVDIEFNYKDLSNRCLTCREKIEQYKNKP